MLSWYIGQVELVKLVAGNDNGSTLKKRQYKQAEYAETKLGTKIAPIPPASRNGWRPPSAAHGERERDGRPTHPRKETHEHAR